MGWPIWAVMRRTWRLRPSTILPRASRWGSLYDREWRIARPHRRFIHDAGPGGQVMPSLSSTPARRAASFPRSARLPPAPSRSWGSSLRLGEARLQLAVVGEQQSLAVAVEPARGIDAGLGDVIPRVRGPPSSVNWQSTM